VLLLPSLCHSPASQFDHDHGALVTRLLFEGTHTVGVEYLHEGALQVRVNQEVILSAGTIDSLKLLMLSGIGNAKYLQWAFLS